VKAIVSTLGACDPAKEWDFVRAPVEGDRAVAGYVFDFNHGRLRNGTIRLHRHLPKDLVKRVSLEVFERKWGKIDGREREQEFLMVSRSRGQTFESAQRSYSLDHWEIKADIPAR
jgi:hypothetical protein